MADDSRVGLVVAGAGARGAYEAGALSVLVPRMAELGAAPTVLVGTSAGALNVAGLACFADAGSTGATEQVVKLWSNVSLSDVANVPTSLARGAGRYLAHLAGLPVRLPSLLDTAPQRKTLSDLLPLEALHDNVATGPIDAVAIATTSVRTGGTVVFVEKKPQVKLPDYDAKRNITYVETRLTIDHVLASAAVPVAFAPVRIEAPAGWYVDGGVRLNAPLKPAIEMGCHRLGVVATHPSSWPEPADQPEVAAPDVFGVASLAMQSLLADRMVEDLRTLSKVNALVAAAGQRTAYEEIEFLFAGPPSSEAGAIGDLANEVFADHFSGLRGVRHPAAWTLERLIGGDPAGHGELLSFLLFEPPFASRAAELGATHAEAQLEPAAGWQSAV